MLAAVVLGGGGCGTTTERHYVAAGTGALCPAGAPADALGTVVVLPEIAFRADQKDVAERTAMIERALSAVFATLPCGTLAAPGGLRPIEAWSSHPEAAVLTALAHEGVDTAVFVRVEELTPRLVVTLSLPFLWSGASEADFRVRAVRTDGGAVLLDRRVRRERAGPFHVRPASWSEAELREGLAGVIGGSAKDDD